MGNFARQTSCHVWLPKARRVRLPPATNKSATDFCTSRIYCLRSSPTWTREVILSQTVNYFVTYISARQADFVRGQRESEDYRFSDSQGASPNSRSCDKPPQTRRGGGGESWFST